MGKIIAALSGSNGRYGHMCTRWTGLQKESKVQKPRRDVSQARAATGRLLLTRKLTIFWSSRRMMRFCFNRSKPIFSLCLVAVASAACDGPSPHFMGIEPVRVEVDGSVFAVRVKGRLAEAVRTNVQYAPRMGPIGPRAAEAMRQVSGCEVREIRGDQALILGVLEC